jgi:hypothetical protein
MAALWPLAAGHLLAMLVVMLPFAFLDALVEWQRQIQSGASLLVIAFGTLRLVNPRHPRALARIPPTQYLGLKFVSRSWFNLDASWALSLALLGALSLAFSLSGQH